MLIMALFFKYCSYLFLIAFIFRLARALSIDKPILMEGAPGCGKSSTVVALAAATGHPLTRLNLSDQTVSMICLLFRVCGR